MKKVKKSKAISGVGICEWGGTLADSGTAYNYERAYNRYFAGMSDTKQSIYLYGTEAGNDTYDEKLGEITAEGVYFRSSVGTIFEGLDNLKMLWTSSIPSNRISSTFLHYGHQVCEDADDDGLTEVCSRMQVTHKPKAKEHSIQVENLRFCLTFDEDYKMIKFLGIAPNTEWETDVHGFTHNLCRFGLCYCQREEETVIFEFATNSN